MRSSNTENFLSLKWVLEPIKYVLLFLSLMAIVLTVIKASHLRWDFSPGGFHTFILLYGDYSILFAATFIIINVQLVARQQAIVETENRKKWEVEETSASLRQCQVYLNDIQIALRDLTETGIHEGMPIAWPGLADISRKHLKKTYPTTYEKFQKMDKQTFHQSVILLYKLDAFASIFIHGIADIDTARKVIGYIYCKQIGMLLGIIAYLKTDNELYRNILQLYDAWKSEYDDGDKALVDLMHE